MYINLDIPNGIKYIYLEYSIVFPKERKYILVDFIVYYIMRSNKLPVHNIPFNGQIPGIS
jgi:hypothetical protein